jgi:hypothetical protein
MDDDGASMTSDMTMADEEPSLGDTRRGDLQREESMLSRKLELLDGFWRKSTL